MRFGVVHRLMTNALAALGVLALVSSGQFSLPVSVVILVGLAGALLVRESWARHPSFRHVDTISLLIVVAVQIVRFALNSSSSLDVLIEFAAALQIVRLATRRGAAHDQQVIVLALLHLIAGTVLGGGLGYGLCFAGVLIVAPGALVLSHLRREVEGNYRQGARDRTGLPVDVPRILRSRRVVGRTFLLSMCLLSIPILLFTAVLFVFFPRVGLSLLLLNNQPPTQMVAFTEKVDLGQVGRLREDRTIAARIRFPEQQGAPPDRIALHLRGATLDHYESRGTWSRTIEEKNRRQQSSSTLIELRRPTGPTREMKVELEPFEPPVVFLPPSAVTVRLDVGPVSYSSQQAPTLTRGAEGDLTYHADDRGIAYTVEIDSTGAPTFRHLDEGDRGRYLELPADLPPRIRELALAWTEGATTPTERARAIEKHLREDYKYDTDTSSTRASAPLDDFLFESKRGHCTFFSSAMAIMLRTVGIPTRTVNGYLGATYNKYGGFYVVRQGEAHSWVEVYIDKEGWTTFDPTPAAGGTAQTKLSEPWATVADFVEATSQRWHHNVVEYNLTQQVALLQSLTKPNGPEDRRRDGARRSWGWLVVGGLLVAAVAAVFVVRRRRTVVAVKSDGSPRARELAKVTTIYERLEGALAAHGVQRAPGTPPLRHAENLVAAAHPLGPEVLEITQVYLSVRFGGMALSDDATLDLERRVRSIRARDLTRQAA